MKVIHLAILVTSIFFMNCTSGNKVGINLDGYQEERVKFGHEQVTDSAGMIVQGAKELAVLSFFEEFNDIVEVYLNRKKIASWNMNDENRKYTSTGYSGNDIGISQFKESDVITIRLVNQRKYVKFNLQPGYPLYTIQRYGGIWYVNLRKQVMILK